AGDEAHAPHAFFEAWAISVARRWADDLERKLRDRIAERIERQILEHNVCESTIGRRIVGALNSLDQRIDGLIFCARVEPPSALREIKRIAVRPHTSDACDSSFTKPDRERERIGIGRAFRRWPALAANRASRGLLLEACGPNHLAGDAHSAVDDRN